MTEQSITPFFEVEKRLARTEAYYRRLRRELGADVSAMLDTVAVSHMRKRQSALLLAAAGNGGNTGGRLRLLYAEQTDPDTESVTSAG